MPKVKATKSDINLSDSQYYFNRELSWLEFNNRVLHEALDPRTPLLERLNYTDLNHEQHSYLQSYFEKHIFPGSADWMLRNLDRWVEAVTPVEDQDIARDLKEILGILLADNRQAWELQSDGRYVQRYPSTDEPERSAQKILMESALQAAGMA